MKIPNQIYDAVKYLVLIAIPAFVTFYMTVDLPNEILVAKWGAALATLLGTLVGIAKVQYNKSDEKYDGTIDPVYANAVTSPAALDIPAAEQPSEEPFPKDEVLLKVKPLE